MTEYTIIGIDPGLANTGIAIVTHDKEGRWQIKDPILVGTKANAKYGERLYIQYSRITEILKNNPCDAVYVEKVFHGRNVSSSISTGCIIGLIHMICFDLEIPVKSILPQKVKAAVGVDKHASKTAILSRINALFNTKIENHHRADAIACGIAGILEERKPNEHVSR